MYNPSEVGERINSLLKQKSIQQKDMLDSCGLNKNAISTMISRGSMLRADNLARIADFLKCSVDYLLGREESFAVENQTSIDLTSEEERLLSLFRSLNEQGKTRLLDEADTYAESEKYANIMENQNTMAG